MRWFKKKERVKLNTYSFTYMVTYIMSNGREKSTELMKIEIPAVSREEAKKKLREFALKKIRIRIF